MVFTPNIKFGIENRMNIDLTIDEQIAIMNQAREIGSLFKRHIRKIIVNSTQYNDSVMQGIHFCFELGENEYH